MKHLNHYIILGILSVLALAGCDQEHLDDTVKVQLPEHGYIFFNTELSTRATLHKDMKRNFSVMGYNWEYINQNDVWTTVRAKAKPNVFYNQKITYNSSSNLHSYTPIKSWEGGKKYAFFGYYPSQDESAGTIDTISANTWEGTPYVTYTLPSNPANMQDVMTAAVYDTDYKTSREVNMTFKHRLAAVDVQMVNLNNPYDVNNTPTDKTDDVDVYLNITNLAINFSNLRYNHVKLWMDETIADEPSGIKGWNPAKSFTLFSNSVKVQPSGTSTNSTIVTTSGNPLIIIPQYIDTKYTEYLKGSVTFNLQYTDEDGNTINLSDAEIVPGNHTHEFNIGRDIMPGRKHTIQLTFTRDAVTVTIVPSGDWIDKNVNIEFD